MSGTIGTQWPGSNHSTIDSRGWLELVSLFLLFSLLFALLSADLIRSILEDPGFSAGTVITGAAIGVCIASGLTGLMLLSWRQNGGRAGQRVGRRAWRHGHLPDGELARRAAIADLQRRERTEGAGVALLVLAAFWAFIGVLQIVGSDSQVHTFAWLLLIVVPGTIAMRAMLDRRRLPQLRALLEQAASDEHG